jgi:hypothetical protein
MRHDHHSLITTEAKLVFINLEGNTLRDHISNLVNLIHKMIDNQFYICCYHENPKQMEQVLRKANLHDEAFNYIIFIPPKLPSYNTNIDHQNYQYPTTELGNLTTEPKENDKVYDSKQLSLLYLLTNDLSQGEKGELFAILEFTKMVKAAIKAELHYPIKILEPKLETIISLQRLTFKPHNQVIHPFPLFDQEGFITLEHVERIISSISSTPCSMFMPEQTQAIASLNNNLIRLPRIIPNITKVQLLAEPSLGTYPTPSYYSQKQINAMRNSQPTAKPVAPSSYISTTLSSKAQAHTEFKKPAVVNYSLKPFISEEFNGRSASAIYVTTQNNNRREADSKNSGRSIGK